MNFIKNMFLFFKKIFNKEDNMKTIETPVKTVEEQEKTNFANSLKVDNAKEKKKKEVETLICVGDGLGIQNKISF